MQKAFAQEKYTVEKSGVKVTVNGSLKVEEIVINPGVETENLGSLLTDLINQAFQEIQQRLARQLMG